MVKSSEQGGIAMKTLEVQMDIFTLRRQGFSFRSIAHKLGIHRDTVKKYLQENCPPAERRRKNHKESILAPFKQTIEDYLHQDNYRSTWLYNLIKNMGYTGGYDTVKTFVRSIKSRLQRQAFIRFETIPGLQAQVDWADFQVIAANRASPHVLSFYHGSRLQPCDIRRACQDLHDANVHGCPHTGFSISWRHSNGDSL
jgi:transposase